MYDVIVVGAGPGGSMCAAECAREGLSTLLIERRRLPREKVCSGMVMGRWAQELITRALGEIPQDVLVFPRYLTGLAIYVPGVERKVVEVNIPIAWRRELDSWFVKKTQEAGAEVMDRKMARAITEEVNRYTVIVENNGRHEQLKTRFIVGADGTKSMVRRYLLPELKVAYRGGIRECYTGAYSGLEQDYFHAFVYPEFGIYPTFFDINHKGDFWLLETGTRVGALPALQLNARVKEILAAEWGFDPSCRPLWRDGWAGFNLQEELVTGKFIPAKDGILLVGDAGSFQIPITGEGISTAVLTGLLAAKAITQGTKGDENAARVDIASIEPIIAKLRHLLKHVAHIREQAKKSNGALAEALLAGWEETLRPFC